MERKNIMDKIKTLQIDDTAIPYDEDDPRYAAITVKIGRAHV